MKVPQVFTVIIEQDPITGYYVAFVSGLPGAHTQAKSMKELQRNLREVVALVLEDSTSLSRASLQSARLYKNRHCQAVRYLT
jgi:predicted RNase H-like HicB family nuclease